MELDEGFEPVQDRAPAQASTLDAGFEQAPSALLDEGFEPKAEAPKTLQELAVQDAPNSQPSVELNPTNLTPAKQPTTADVQKLISEQQAIDEFPNAVGNLATNTVSQIGAPFMVPTQLATNIASRGDAAIGAFFKEGPTKFSDVADAFLNPRILRDYRRAGGYPEKIQDIMGEEIGRGPIDVLRALAKEIVPQVYPHEMLKNDEGNTPISQIAPMLGGGEDPLVNIVTDYALDPLAHTKIAGKLDPALRGAAKTEEEALDVKSLIKNWEKRQEIGSGLGLEAERGDRALLQFNVPGMSRPIVIKGQKYMSMLDEMNTTLGAKLRPLAQNSGWGAFDTGLTMQELDAALDPKRVEDAASGILSAGEPKEATIRYAKNMHEFGEEKGAVLSNAQGIKIDPNQQEDAKKIVEAWKTVDEAGNAAIRENGGKDLSAINLNLTPEEKQKAVDRIKRKFGDIPSLIVQDGNTLHDFMFGQGTYDSGRALKEEAVRAKRLQESADELGKAAQSRGLNITADSAKKRIELSTPAMNAILERATGVVEPFNPNQSEVVLKNYQNKLEVARNLKMYNFVKDTYGYTAAEIPAAIEGANARVANAYREGRAPSIEDMRLSSMKADDFRPMSSRMFNKLDTFKNADDTAYTVEKTLLYPKEIADRVESKWLQPSKEGMLASLEWYQRQKAKNMLSNFYRLGKQPVENFFKTLSLGVPLENITKETAIGMGAKKDAIAQLAEQLPSVSETVLSGVDLKDKIKVSMKMLDDPEVNNAVNTFYGSLHETAKQDKLDKVFALKDWADKLKSAPTRAVEMINDNPVSKFVRHAGNMSDGILKKAYFRTLIEKGYGADEAAKMVGDHLMDFTRGTALQKNLRYVTPFAAFQLKNVETLLPLIASNPGAANLANPSNGYLRKAIEETNEWNPQDAQALQKALPYYRSPILGPILRGQKTLLGNESLARDIMEKYISWGMGDKEQDKLKAGFQLSLMIPTQATAAMDFIDPTHANENFHSPIIAAAGMGLLGYDLYQGKTIPTKGTPLENADKIVGALKELNPVEYPKFFNKVALPVIEKALPDFKQRLRDGPIPARLAQVLKLQLGNDLDMKGMRPDEDTIRSMTQMKMFGMGSLDKADFTYMMQQMQLMSAMKQTDKLMDQKITKNGRTEALRVVGGIKSIVKELNYNTKIYNDYKARMSKVGGSLDPDTEAQINQLMEQAPSEDLDGLEPAPAIDNPIPEVEREPQSTDESIFDTASRLTRNNIGQPEQEAPPPEAPSMLQRPPEPEEVSRETPPERSKRLETPDGGSYDPFTWKYYSPEGEPQNPPPRYPQEDDRAPQGGIDIDDPKLQKAYHYLREHGVEPHRALTIAQAHANRGTGNIDRNIVQEDTRPKAQDRPVNRMTDEEFKEADLYEPLRERAMTANPADPQGWYAFYAPEIEATRKDWTRKYGTSPEGQREVDKIVRDYLDKIVDFSYHKLPPSPSTLRGIKEGRVQIITRNGENADRTPAMAPGPKDTGGEEFHMGAGSVDEGFPASQSGRMNVTNSMLTHADSIYDDLYERYPEFRRVVNQAPEEGYSSKELMQKVKGTVLERNTLLKEYINQVKLINEHKASLRRQR